MAVLDMKMWSHDDVIFFEKEMASQFVTLRNSALSWNTKKTTLAGEVCRRFLNTSPSLVADNGVDMHLDKLAFKMMRSGYSQKERDQIIREVTAQYRNIVSLAEEGRRPLYRRSSWQKFERTLKNKKKAKRWYGEADAVMFVQSSPDSILKREIEEVMRTNGMKVRVVEKGGRQVGNIVQRSDVEPVKACGKECSICRSSPGGQCWKEGVCYSVTCTVCEK